LKARWPNKILPPLCPRIAKPTKSDARAIIKSNAEHHTCVEID
jgi:hypothetical protein